LPQEVLFARVYTFENVIPTGESLAILSALEVTIATHPNSPSVLVRGPADDVAAACDFLAAIDRPQASCTVQTWAVYVSKRMQTGWDLAGAIGSVLDAPNMLVISPGAVTLNVSGDQISAALNIIADGSNVEVLQRPHVSLIHGVPAKIESIQEVPVPQTTVSQGISQTSISYRKVGLQLEVLPTFLSPGRLRLALSQTNGIIGQNVNIAGNDVPIIQSQTVSTTAEVLVGQTVILGGVTTQRVRETKGILRNTREVEEGSLYLIMSTSVEIPRAIPVLEDPSPPSAPLLQDEFSSGVLPQRAEIFERPSVLPSRDELPLPVK
jgi:type II secretory pathway component GspD/PulD (secretin)